MSESNGGNGRGCRHIHQARRAERSVTNEKVASAGNPLAVLAFRCPNMEMPMNAIIYLVGLVVVVMFILSLIGLR
jgi:hypothetical protein